ncbi:MAG: hypothetical protein P0121_10540 [Nitrospira sp.]|nr:hypothetical protein [Nitrospira sp.]
MARRYGLRDDQWEKIEPLLPGREAQRDDVMQGVLVEMVKKFRRCRVLAEIPRTTAGARKNRTGCL